MSIKQFQQEVSKGLPFPAYLFHSTGDFLLYEAASIVKELCCGEDVFNFAVYDLKSPDDSLPIDGILDVLNTLPFMSGRRTVIVKNLQKLAKKDLKKLESYLANPSGTSLLIMLYEGKSPKLFDAPALKNLKSIPLNVQEQDIPLWIKERAKRKGMSFTDRAVEYLVSTIGTDLGMIYAEIEKFSSLDTPEKGGAVIDVEDIRGAVYSGAEHDAFDLVNALNRKDEKTVFTVFESFGRSMEPQMLLGALNWQYAGMYSRAERKDERKFHRIFSLLHEADVSIKTSQNYVLEDLLIKLLKIG